MTRLAIYNVLDAMNKLSEKMDRLDDKAWNYSQENNEKKAAYYEKKTDEIDQKLSGYCECLKMLGLGVWKDNTGHYHIPLDDIIKAT